jgi:lysophospholipase L1-like esterase
MIDKYIKAYTDIIQREAKQVWIKEKGALPERKKRQVKKLTVKALRQIIKEDGLQKKFKGYSRWKRNMLITALAQVGYI